MNPARLLGYVWLDTRGKLTHIWAAHLEFRMHAPREGGMSMKEGHIFVVVSFQAAEWPPPHDRPISIRPVGDQGSIAALYATPEGRIKFSVGDMVALSHPLIFLGHGSAVIDVGWKDGSATISVNSVRVSGIPVGPLPISVQLIVPRSGGARRVGETEPKPPVQDGRRWSDLRFRAPPPVAGHELVSAGVRPGAGANLYGFVDREGKRMSGMSMLVAIVPLEGPHQWLPIATGFLISYRLFATAKHTITDSDTGEILPNLGAVHMDSRKQDVELTRVAGIVCHKTCDVAIGFLDFRTDLPLPGINPVFELTERIPPIGERVGAFAYPAGRKTVDGEYTALWLDAKGAAGPIEEYYPDGRDRRMLPGRCYQAGFGTVGGASGGPVADGSGRVFGINSTGFDGTDLSFVSSIIDVLDLRLATFPLPDGRHVQDVSVRDLAGLGFLALHKEE